ncbi:MAG: heme exporter protein CcmB [Bacteroidia bacterium]
MRSIIILRDLIYKDMLLEVRQRYALSGIVLYVFSTVFIVYLSFVVIDPTAWISLYWIIILFASVNAVAKSFMLEGQGRLLYYYSLASPSMIILSKMIYNFLLLVFLSLLAFIIFSFFMGNEMENLQFFALVQLLGSSGFAFSFTMVSAIASKARNSATLMPILSFPVILPQLLLLIRLSQRSMAGLSIEEGGQELWALLALNAIVLVVSYLLFPYLWRE